MSEASVAGPDVEDRDVALRDAELVVQEGELGDRVEQVAADAHAVDVVRRRAEHAVFFEPLEQPEPVVEARVVRRQPVAEDVLTPLLPHVTAVAAELPHVDAAADVVVAPLRRRRGRMSAVAPSVLGEQRMVGVPLLLSHEWRHQKLPLPNGRQHFFARPRAGHGVAERGIESIEDRRTQQERLHVLRLPLQHFFEQIIQHEVVAAAERLDEAGGIGMSLQRQSS